jgi:hypothetical protein
MTWYWLPDDNLIHEDDLIKGGEDPPWAMRAGGVHNSNNNNNNNIIIHRPPWRCGQEALGACGEADLMLVLHLLLLLHTY